MRNKQFNALLIVLMGVVIVLLISLFRNRNQTIGSWSEIEPKIAKEFGSDKQIHQAAKQLSLAIQNALEQPLSRAMESEKKIARAINCIDYIVLKKDEKFQDQNLFSNIVEKTRDISISTRAREKKYIEYNSQLGGKVFPVTESKSEDCDFGFNE